MEIINFFFEPIRTIVPKLPGTLLNLFIGYLAIQLIIWSLSHLLKLTNLPKLRGIILSIVRMTLWVILIIFLANSLGFDKLAIAISSSVLVLVFFLNTGLAPLITDIVSGIFLCTDPDFKTGSRISFGKGENAVEGIIREVDMRKVRLTDSDGNTHIVPNSVIDKDSWVVLDRPETAMKARANFAKEKARELIKSKLKK